MGWQFLCDWRGCNDPADWWDADGEHWCDKHRHSLVARAQTKREDAPDNVGDPHIWWSIPLGAWVCLNSQGEGYGPDAKAAYDNWSGAYD